MAKEKTTDTRTTLERMLAIQQEIGSIEKDKETDKGPIYKYRSIENVYARIHELLVIHGLIVTKHLLNHDIRSVELQTRNGPKTYTMLTLHYRYTFNSTMGPEITTESVGSGMDDGDKAAGKADSYAAKYMFCGLFTVPTEDLLDTDKTQYGESEDELLNKARTAQVTKATPETVSEPAQPPKGFTQQPLKNAEGKTQAEAAIEKARALQQRNKTSAKPATDTPPKAAAPQPAAPGNKPLGPTVVRNICDTFQETFQLGTKAVELIVGAATTNWTQKEKQISVAVHNAITEGGLAIGAVVLPYILRNTSEHLATPEGDIQNILETMVQIEGKDWTAMNINVIADALEEVRHGKRTLASLAE